MYMFSKLPLQSGHGQQLGLVFGCCVYHMSYHPESLIVQAFSSVRLPCAQCSASDREACVSVLHGSI